MPVWLPDEANAFLWHAAVRPAAESTLAVAEALEAQPSCTHALIGTGQRNDVLHGYLFAGGFMGYIAKQGTGLTSENLRTAMLWGSVMASFCVEGFSYDQLRGIEESCVANRFERLVRMCEIPR